MKVRILRDLKKIVKDSGPLFRSQVSTHSLPSREKHEVCGVHYEIEPDNVKQSSHVKTVYIMKY